MKEEIITFRTNNQEKQLIKNKANEAKMKMSDYIRACCLVGIKYKIITNTEITTEIIEINE